jgi:hypothetical protein
MLISRLFRVVVVSTVIDVVVLDARMHLRRLCIPTRPALFPYPLGLRDTRFKVLQHRLLCIAPTILPVLCQYFPQTSDIGICHSSRGASRLVSNRQLQPRPTSERMRPYHDAGAKHVQCKLRASASIYPLQDLICLSRGTVLAGLCEAPSGVNKRSSRGTF